MNYLNRERARKVLAAKGIRSADDMPDHAFKRVYTARNRAIFDAVIFRNETYLTAGEPFGLSRERVRCVVIRALRDVFGKHPKYVL